MSHFPFVTIVLRSPSFFALTLYSFLVQYCCINCIQLVPNLHELEQLYAGNPEVVFVGVHSQKFENEKEDANVRDAIIKYEIDHPCVNDPDRHLWRYP